MIFMAIPISSIMNILNSSSAAVTVHKFKKPKHLTSSCVNKRPQKGNYVLIIYSKVGVLTDGT